VYLSTHLTAYLPSGTKTYSKSVMQMRLWSIFSKLCLYNTTFPNTY